MSIKEQRKRSYRTPSGHNLKDKVSGTRTIFSVEEGQKQRSKKTELNSLPEINQACKTDGPQQRDSQQVQTPKHRILRSRFSDHTPKQTLSADSAIPSDVESDNFDTPPTTPIASFRKVIKCQRIKEKTTNKMNKKEEMTVDKPEAAVEGEGALVVQELEKMIADHDEQDGPKLIDVRSVHAMFKRMQDDFQSKLRALEAKMNDITGAVQKDGINSDAGRSSDGHSLDDACDQINKLTLKTRAVSSAVQNAWEDRCQIHERLEKLELNCIKKNDCPHRSNALREEVPKNAAT